MSDVSRCLDLTIRVAASNDAPTILALIRELAEYERRAHEVVATVELLRENLFGPHPVAEAVVAEIAGRIVGYAIYFTSFSTFTGLPGFYMEDIYVQPPVRGQGIGKRLLARVAQRAVERGCGRLEWSVLDWNKSSIRFYESLGACALSDWTAYRLTSEEISKLAAADC